MPAADPPLHGVRVLVTRPPGQTAGLMERIRAAGGEPVAFPTLQIEPLTPSEEQVAQLARADVVIFISANAVAHGYRALQGRAAAGKRIAAIGRATKSALEKKGCRDVTVPPDGETSEALLETGGLRNVAGRRICIVRGRGGREWLKQCLESRGASVSYLECYRRVLPELDPGPLVRALDDAAGELVITATSATGLANLLEMAPPGHRRQLLTRPLVVIGERQKAAALDRGWTGPVLESAADDDHILQAILAWRARACDTVRRYPSMPREND